MKHFVNNTFVNFRFVSNRTDNLEKTVHIHLK